MSTRQPVYVPLEDGERELLLKLLNVASYECYRYIESNVGTGQSVAAAERELDQIEVLCERVEQLVPLTRADMLRALRFIGNMVVDDAELRSEGRRLYPVLKARCTNVLRLARQGS